MIHLIYIVIILVVLLYLIAEKDKREDVEDDLRRANSRLAEMKNCVSREKFQKQVDDNISAGMKIAVLEEKLKSGEEQFIKSIIDYLIEERGSDVFSCNHKVCKAFNVDPKSNKAIVVCQIYDMVERINDYRKDITRLRKKDSDSIYTIGKLTNEVEFLKERRKKVRSFMPVRAVRQSTLNGKVKK